MFTFLVGLELDRGLLSGQGRLAVTGSLSSTALPFGLGMLPAWYLLGGHPVAHRPAFVLFLGTAMSVTACRCWRWWRSPSAVPGSRGCC